AGGRVPALPGGGGRPLLGRPCGRPSRRCARATARLARRDGGACGRRRPARRVIEEFKAAQRDRLIALCGATGADEPELLADELFLLLEGARVSAQSV